MQTGPGTPDGGTGPVPVRVRLDVSYDGTDFSGWAEQPGRRTVAGVLRAALERLFGVGGPIGAPGATGLTVAGRTDAGVHATGQVCHVDLPAPRWTELAATARYRLAGMLPADLRVAALTEVPASFDARFSALWRQYRYRVVDRPWAAPVLRHRDTLTWARPLDEVAMNAAATGLLGEHDYAAFCRRKENATTIRTMARLDWCRDADGILVATVRADAFCQAMVRSLVGAMLAVGEGRRPVPWPAGLLDLRRRADEVMVAPAHGLTLVQVGYPDDPAGYAQRAEQTRQRRG